MNCKIPKLTQKVTIYEKIADIKLKSAWQVLKVSIVSKVKNDDDQPKSLAKNYLKQGRFSKALNLTIVQAIQ